MRGLYLNFRQIGLLLAPLVVLFYFYTNAHQGASLINYVTELISSVTEDQDNYKELAKEAFEKQYYKELDSIRDNYQTDLFSIFRNDRETTSWMIAHFYEIYANSDTNRSTKNSSMQSGSQNNISKLNKIQKDIDKRNQNISTNLGNSSSSFVPIDQADIEYIKHLISLRNLEVHTEKIEYADIDLNMFNLQMVLSSSKKPYVIINNEVYQKRQRVQGTDAIVEKIENERVLLKNEKESKWLYLNN